jgi:RNA polymerase sigma factor (sigma-70 family)
MSNEEHGQEFLQFVADNEARLKKNLKKNITYNPDIFDDVFQDTIIKVYDRIMKGVIIKDFEQYFFIASKFQYINEDNKVKKRLKVEDREIDTDDDRFAEDDNAWKIKEERNENINDLFKFLSKRLNEVFTPAEADIFLIYYRLKSEKAGISYKKMTKITGRSFSEISQIIQRCKRFIKEDKEIIEYKRKILNGNID